MLTTVGGFTPRSPVHDGSGLLDPKDAFKSLFVRGKVPVRGSIGVSAPSLPMPLGTPTTPSTIRLLPAPPAPDSSLIKLSGVCLTLSLAVRLMLFFPFSAACN